MISGKMVRRQYSIRSPEERRTGVSKETILYIFKGGAEGDHCCDLAFCTLFCSQ